MALSSIKGLKCFLKPEGGALKHKTELEQTNLKKFKCQGYLPGRGMLKL